MKTPQRKLDSNRRYRERNREAVLYHKRNNRLRRFGLEPKDLDNMLRAQYHKCLICERPLQRDGKALDSAHLDHCHECGQVRGLLCKRCNGLLGYLESSTPTVFARAFLFVEDHRAQHEKESLALQPGVQYANEVEDKT